MVRILWNMLLPMCAYYVCINIKNSAFCSQRTRKYDISCSPFNKEPYQLIFMLETLGSQRSWNWALNFGRWTEGFKWLVNFKNTCVCSCLFRANSASSGVANCSRRSRWWERTRHIWIFNGDYEKWLSNPHVLGSKNTASFSLAWLVRLQSSA